jgi:glycine hydroxymethyltransferase
MLKTVKEKDLELYNIVQEEYERQNTGIEMIASESFVPTQVMELQGSILTNKTMEGFPGKRYHAGHQAIDKMETLGIERAKELYGAEHANIQLHSGSQANQCVYASIINPGDTIMGMRLDQGGHLTHGSKVNLSGKMYNAVSYGVDKETETIDYEEMEKIAKEHMPKVIIAGASSYPREIDYERISKIAKSVGAYFLVDMAHIAGLVAAGILPSPVPYADFVTSTTTKTLAGARGGFILCKKEYAKKIDKAVFPCVQGSAHLHIMGAKTFTFKNAMTEEYRECMRQVVKNAKALGEALKEKGFRLVSGGTDNHILLVDLRSKGLTGAQLDEALASVGITVNKNMIPYDPAKPMVTSGVRIGATAMTIKGMKEKEMIEIADMINTVAENMDNEEVMKEVKRKSTELALKFPMYSGYFE